MDQSFKSKSTVDTNRKNVSDLAPKTSVLAPFRVFALIAFLLPSVLAINGCSDQTQPRVPEVVGRNAFPMDQNYSGPSLLPLRIEATPMDEDLYRFFIIAFGASPGGIYLEQLREAVSAGMSVKQVVNVFTTKEQFLSRYPRSMTDGDFATQLVAKVVGDSAIESVKSEAIRDIQEALTLPSWTRGDVIFAIFNNLAKKPENDPKWGATSRLLANRVIVARFFSEQIQFRSQDLTLLSASIDWVSSSALPKDLQSSIAYAIETKGGQALLPSGITMGELKASAYRAWLTEPVYLDQQRLEQNWAFLASEQVCQGFDSPDIIPAPMTEMNWNVKALGAFYPNRDLSRIPYQSIIDWVSKLEIPKPFEALNLDVSSNPSISSDLIVFVNAIKDLNEVLNSASRSNLYRERLKAALVDYAQSNALSKGLDANFSWAKVGQEPVHFNVLPLTINLIHSFAITFDSMSTTEREVVGSWLQRIVATVFKGSWGSRQDNKAYFRTQIALSWGILTGQKHLIENAIVLFKHAINEMRPDGSFPTESARGGSANMYQASATESIVSLATSLQEHFGLPAMQFHRNGRSIWSAATRSVDIWKDRLVEIRKYGKLCPGGSSGSLEDPVSWERLDSDLSFLKIALKRSAPADLKVRIQALPFENLARLYDGDSREGIDLYHGVMSE